jgi:hypothetical protein
LSAPVDVFFVSVLEGLGLAVRRALGDGDAVTSGDGDTDANAAVEAESVGGNGAAPLAGAADVAQPLIPTATSTPAIVSASQRFIVIVPPR